MASKQDVMPKVKTVVKVREPSFFEDFQAVQTELKNPVNDTAGYADRYKYTKLPKLLDDAKDVLLKNNFILTGQLQGKEVITTIEHRSGRKLESTVLLPEVIKDAQEYGSWVTYARRYTLLTVLGIAGEEDDDGEVTKSKKPVETKPLLSQPVKPAPEEIKGEVEALQEAKVPIPASMFNFPGEDKGERPTEVALEGVMYKFREGTNKNGNPYRAWFPPKESGLPVFWTDGAFRNALAESKAAQISPDDLPF